MAAGRWKFARMEGAAGVQLAARRIGTNRPRSARFGAGDRPLVGTRACRGRVVEAHWFVPTRGECPRAARCRPSRPGSSPRAWERMLSPLGKSTRRGSSPRTWGTQVFDLGGEFVERFIPRTWGTRPEAEAEWQDVRFIPTHVGNATGPRTSGRRRSVHPHARGERGRLRDVGQRAVRFIPTHVGNALATKPAPELTAVHPLARGERFEPPAELTSSGGSSPRTWGTRRQSRHQDRRFRFIPTHVGNAGVPGRQQAARAVHPHARGERRSTGRERRAHAGSSPRTWGTLEPCKCVHLRTRFIPTHVGNAREHAADAGRRAVHPHARGERCRRPGGRVMFAGSSPRTWGTRIGSRGMAVKRRFIPTHVGNAHAGWLMPRVDYGSSPRTWGTLFQSQFGSLHCRFIPTHVGNAAMRRRPSTSRAVHPHARGERGDERQRAIHVHGSSPRTWGTPGRARHA